MSSENPEYRHQYDVIKASKIFHGNWYKRRYPDVARLKIDPLTHYIKYGARMLRDPSSSFSTKYYVEKQANLNLAEENPLYHYIVTGKNSNKYRSKEEEDREEVKRLRFMLWNGLSSYAAPLLSMIVFSPKFVLKARYDAGLAAAVWLDFKGDKIAAIFYLEYIGVLFPDRKTSFRHGVPLSLLYYKSGNVAESSRVLQGIDTDKSNVNTILAKANTEVGVRKIELVNEIYDDNGLARLRVEGNVDSISLDKLRSNPCSYGGPDYGKVSVIVPAYNSGRSIEVALRSLLQQTYSNIEILVVDDCSTDDTFERVVTLSRTDARIVPIRQEANSGAYAARNRALSEVTGNFVTTHDADDWSHPQKIEKQVRAVVDDRDAIASVSFWARVNSGFTFTSNWRLSSEISHWNRSSFLIRKFALDRLEGWDEVRVGADTELIWRFEAMFGKDKLVSTLPGVPLAFAEDDAGSLTRQKETHVSSNYFGLRHLYREVSRYWLKLRPLGLTHAEKTVKRGMLPAEMFRGFFRPANLGLLIEADCSSELQMQAAKALWLDMGENTVGVRHLPNVLTTIQEGEELQLASTYFELISQENVYAILPHGSVSANATVDLNSLND